MFECSAVILVSQKTADINKTSDMQPDNAACWLRRYVSCRNADYKRFGIYNPVCFYSAGGANAYLDFVGSFFQIHPSFHAGFQGRNAPDKLDCVPIIRCL